MAPVPNEQRQGHVALSEIYSSTCASLFVSGSSFLGT